MKKLETLEKIKKFIIAKSKKKDKTPKSNSQKSKNKNNKKFNGKEYKYIHDPEHKKNPGPGFYEVPAGWSNNPRDKKDDTIKTIPEELDKKIEELEQKGFTKSEIGQEIIKEMGNGDPAKIKENIKSIDKEDKLALVEQSNDLTILAANAKDNNVEVRNSVYEKVQYDDNISAKAIKDFLDNDKALSDYRNENKIEEKSPEALGSLNKNEDNTVEESKEKEEQIHKYLPLLLTLLQNTDNKNIIDYYMKNGNKMEKANLSYNDNITENEREELEKNIDEEIISKSKEIFKDDSFIEKFNIKDTADLINELHKNSPFDFFVNNEFDEIKEKNNSFVDKTKDDFNNEKVSIENAKNKTNKDIDQVDKKKKRTKRTIDYVKQKINEQIKKINDRKISDAITTDNKEKLHKLSESKNDDIRKAVARNSNTNNSDLHYLSKDKNSDVRKSVAENPNTSTASLIDLMNDKNVEVRKAARNSFNDYMDELKKIIDMQSNPQKSNSENGKKEDKKDNNKKEKNKNEDNGKDYTSSFSKNNLSSDEKNKFISELEIMTSEKLPYTFYNEQIKQIPKEIKKGLSVSAAFIKTINNSNDTSPFIYALKRLRSKNMINIEDCFTLIERLKPEKKIDIVSSNFATSEILDSYVFDKEPIALAAIGNKNISNEALIDAYELSKSSNVKELALKKLQERGVEIPANKHTKNTSNNSENKTTEETNTSLSNNKKVEKIKSGELTFDKIEDYEKEDPKVRRAIISYDKTPLSFLQKVLDNEKDESILKEAKNKFVKRNMSIIKKVKKEQYLQNMDRSKYESDEAFEKAKERIRNMSDEEFEKHMSLIFKKKNK